MKVATRQNKKTGEMNVEYANVANQPSFRYCLLKSIIESIDLDITMFIDTNQSVASKPIEQIEAGLQQMNLRYYSMLVPSNPQIVFGLKMSQNNKRPINEHKIVLELSGNAFPKELFEIIKNYDNAFGFGKNKPFEELCSDFRLSNGLVLFNKDYFQESLYDSVVCEALRSSFNVERFVRLAEYEMAV